MMIAEYFTMFGFGYHKQQQSSFLSFEELWPRHVKELCAKMMTLLKTGGSGFSIYIHREGLLPTCLLHHFLSLSLWKLWKLPGQACIRCTCWFSPLGCCPAGAWLAEGCSATIRRQRQLPQGSHNHTSPLCRRCGEATVPIPSTVAKLVRCSEVRWVLLEETTRWTNLARPWCQLDMITEEAPVSPYPHVSRSLSLFYFNIAVQFQQFVAVVSELHSSGKSFLDVLGQMMDSTLNTVFILTRYVFSIPSLFIKCCNQVAIKEFMY